MIVFCNGMLRGGSTLQFNLVRRLLEVSGRGISHGYMDVGSRRLVDFSHWSQEPLYHLVKSHSVLPEFEAFMSGGGKACYIYRDVRDVAASAQRKFPITKSELIGLIDEAVATDARIRVVGSMRVPSSPSPSPGRWGMAGRFRAWREFLAPRRKAAERKQNDQAPISASPREL